MGRGGFLPDKHARLLHIVPTYIVIEDTTSRSLLFNLRTIKILIGVSRRQHVWLE